MSMMSMEDIVYDMDQYVDLSEHALYDMIQTRQARKVLLDKFTSNPILWSKKFAVTVKMAQNRSQRSGLTSTFHGLRILIQRQTLYAIENGQYQTMDGSKVIIDPNDVINSAKQTKYYSTKGISNIPSNETKEVLNSTQHIDIDILNTDCLDAAYSLLSDGYNPCLLNMANAHMPGGGFQDGNGAQEENLCRRTTLITALVNYVKNRNDKLDKTRKWSYPIEAFGSIYVPNVVVFRSNEHLGYDLLAKPYKMSIITAAMFVRPKYDKHFEYTKASKPQITEKLKSVLRVAYDNGHDSVVLSAWGCGAFKNPPLGQSKLWKSILFGDKEFQGKFKKIIFAVFDDHNAGKQHNPFGNFLPFIQTFNITQKRIKEFVNGISDDIEMKNDDNKNNNNWMDAFNTLNEIFTKISDIKQAQSKDIDLDFSVINRKLGGNYNAMRVLYCAGFKRSSDGSRLQLEQKRIGIALNVQKKLQQQQNN